MRGSEGLWNEALDRELIALVNEHGRKWTLLSELFSVEKTKVALKMRYQNYLCDNPARGKPDYLQLQEPSNPIQKAIQKRKHQFNRDGSETDERVIPEEALQTRESLLIAHSYNPNEFELVNSTSNYWDSNAGGGNVITLYQSKITVKSKGNKLDYHDFIKELTKNIKPINIENGNSSVNNLVIPLADLHFPILTLEFASKYLLELEGIVAKGYNEIVIEMLGDTFHSNSMRSSQTIRGTILNDVDMVFAIEEAKAFFDCIMKSAISNSNKVTIEYASGNHSDFEYMFCEYLKAKYPQVIINNHLEPRKAFRIGNVGIMITHGNFAKKKDYPMLFANEFKDIWSESSWLEVHSAHYHTMESKNDFGVIHRQLGTLKPNDQYEKDNGFTMGYKTTQVFEYSEDKLKVIYDIG